VPDQFDLRGPADGFHRSADRAGGDARRLRRRCQLGVTAPRTAGGAVAISARTSCRAGATAPARKALLLICRGGQPPGTASWGFNSVSWGFNSAFMVIWAGLRGRGGGAEMQGSSGRLSPRCPDDQAQ
jgi:hypothetical protein